MRPIVLLGPQRFRPTLAAALAELGRGEEVAGITAGWQDREDADEELRGHLEGRFRNLGLYRRMLTVFEKDPALHRAHRLRQARLQELQELYRLRLSHALDAARRLLARTGDGDLLARARREAVQTVAELDRAHLAAITEIHQEFQQAQTPWERPALVAERELLRRELGGIDALVVAGGHVATLLNRLRLLGVLELAAADLPLVAWSAGAMVLSDRVLVYHDSPPQGPGNAEMLEVGMGLVPGLLLLPHARRRLRLDDPIRVGMLATRTAPAMCLTLEEGAELHCRPEGTEARGGVRALTPGGAVVPADGIVDGGRG